jgi:DNA-directed RNA polymerase subunit beta'
MEKTKKEKAFFRNTIIDKGSLKELMSWSFRNFGMARAVFLADSLKKLGFQSATKAGISISIEDLKVPSLKNHFVKNAEEETKDSQIKCYRGEITEAERVQQFTINWNITSELLKDEIVNYLTTFDPLNPVYLMAFSGARGNISQIRQLVGMRGLMVGPSGDIIDIPITKNFREGLSITDYMISAYGARKGVVDTALKTADSGYLTRRLIDVAQDVLIKENDCYSKQGIFLFDLNNGKGNIIKLKNRLLGRVLAKDINYENSNLLLASKNQQINQILIKKLEENHINKIFVRSPLTCELSRSVCKNCYGWNLSRGKLVDLGEAIGIIAAQSIGEPGTQLTMRTFHTGGIYSSESSLQIFSKVSCKVIFPKDIKTVRTRTYEGTEALILQIPTNIHLIDFNNNVSNIFLKRDTILFIRNNQYVKKDELISSAPQKVSTKKEKKNIMSKTSGEIFVKTKIDNFDNYNEKSQNQLIWILFGKVLNIPLYSKIKQNKFCNLKPSTSIANTKLVNYRNGFLNISNPKDYNKLNFKNINLLFNTFLLKNSQIYKSFSYNNFDRITNKLIILKFDKNKYFYIRKPSNLLNKNLNVGELINTNYKTNVDGKIYYIKLKKNLLIVSSKNYEIDEGGAIFFLAQEKFILLKKNLLAPKKSQIWLQTNTKISNNLFNKNSGFVTVVNLGSFALINFKSCSFIKLNKNKINFQMNKKLIFPGEKIFNRIYIKKIIYLQIFKNFNNIFLLFRPGFLYEFEKTKIEKKISLKQNKIKNKFQKINFLKFKNCQKIKIRNKKSLSLIKTELVFLTNEKLLKEHLYNISFIKNFNDYSLKLNIFENFFYKNNLSKYLDSSESKISLLIENSQYVESNTVLANIDFLPRLKVKILNIKEKKFFNYKRILIISIENYKNLYTENKNLIYSKTGLIKTGDFISKNLIFSNCGFIEKNSSNKIKLRLAKIFLFSKGASIFYSNSHFIKENEILGILFYRRSQTGDIIKGLPKIEEILEGRKSKTIIKSFKNPCLFLDIKMDFISTKKNYNIFIFIDKFGLKIYRQSNFKEIFINREDFLNIGRPINCSSGNPHNTLKYLNRYYKEFLEPYQAAYRTLKKIQSYLLNSIQIIYSSQNVTISDKHIEIIIKKMTSKVIIDKKGDSGISTGEYIDLRQVNNMNVILSKNNSKKIVYRPLLFGITKASLITESFISSSSFQQTVRVLSYAAIQGKVDWLKGLKENVIIGRLIPAGTGFNSYEHISHLNVRLPKKLNFIKKL